MQMTPSKNGITLISTLTFFIQYTNPFLKETQRGRKPFTLPQVQMRGIFRNVKSCD